MMSGNEDNCLGETRGDNMPICIGEFSRGNVGYYANTLGAWKKMGAEKQIMSSWDG